MLDLLPTKMVLESVSDNEILTLREFTGLQNFTPSISPVPVDIGTVPGGVLAAVSTMKDGKITEYLTARKCYCAFVEEPTFIYIDTIFPISGNPDDGKEFAAECCDYMQTTYPGKTIVWLQRVGHPATDTIVQYLVTDINDKIIF